MSGLRVALFSFPRLVHGGGFEEYLIGLAKMLVARGHDVSVVTADARTYRLLNVVLNVYYGNPLRYDNSRVTRSQLEERFGAATLHEVSPRRMARLLRSADVVYTKNEVLDLSILRLLRASTLPPIVCGVHTPMAYQRTPTRQARFHNALYLGRVYRSLLHGISAVHVSNSFDAGLFPRAFGWPKRRLFEIPYPYPVQDIQASPLATTAATRVLWGARLTQQKGVDVLLQTVEQLVDESFEFTIAGSGEPTLEAATRAASERLPNVTYLGHVAHERMEALYAAADVALVTSNWETFPYSCLEPQARGIPVVAPDIPGCADIVDDGVTGFRFRPGDAGAAVAALRRVRAWSDEQRAEVSAASIERVRSRSAADVVDGRLEQMLVDATGFQRWKGRRTG